MRGGDHEDIRAARHLLNLDLIKKCAGFAQSLREAITKIFYHLLPDEVLHRAIHAQGSDGPDGHIRHEELCKNDIDPRTGGVLSVDGDVLGRGLHEEARFTRVRGRAGESEDQPQHRAENCEGDNEPRPPEQDT